MSSGNFRLPGDRNFSLPCSSVIACTQRAIGGLSKISQTGSIIRLGFVYELIVQRDSVTGSRRDLVLHKPPPAFSNDIIPKPVSPWRWRTYLENLKKCREILVWIEKLLLLEARNHILLNNDLHSLTLTKTKVPAVNIIFRIFILSTPDV